MLACTSRWFRIAPLRLPSSSGRATERTARSRLGRWRKYPSCHHKPLKRYAASSTANSSCPCAKRGLGESWARCHHGHVDAVRGLPCVAWVSTSSSARDRALSAGDLVVAMVAARIVEPHRQTGHHALVAQHHAAGDHQLHIADALEDDLYAAMETCSSASPTLKRSWPSATQGRRVGSLRPHVQLLQGVTSRWPTSATIATARRASCRSTMGCSTNKIGNSAFFAASWFDVNLGQSEDPPSSRSSGILFRFRHQTSCARL